MACTRIITALTFVLFLYACAEDTSGGVEGSDASGDSSNTARDSATDAGEATEDAMLSVPDGMVSTLDGMVSTPDSTVSMPDATFPDATLGDATIVTPDAAVECVRPEECNVPTDVCKGAALTDYEPTCVDGKCGVSTRNGTCADGTDTCRGLNHITYEPQCANATSCGNPAETVTPCDAPGDVCKGGELSEYTASCDPTDGCGVDSKISACPADASLCRDLFHVSYTPSCASGSTCDSSGTELVKECTAPADSCAKGQLTQYAATCDAAKGCGTTSRTASCPTNASLCKELDFISYIPTCTDGTSCGKPQASVKNCTAPAPSCSGGQITRYSATCDALKGCGTTSQTASCPEAAATCEITRQGPLLTTYKPTCLDAGSCDKPTVTQMICTAPADECSNNVWYNYSPACDASNESCLVRTSKTACSSLDSCTVKLGDLGCTMTINVGQCDAAKGCYASTKEISCSRSKCDCKTRSCI